MKPRLVARGTKEAIMTNTRTETDSIGPIEVPADAYWGAQTQRSLQNFPFAEREQMPIRLVHAQAIVKQAAARVNRKHGLDDGTADAIDEAINPDIRRPLLFSLNEISAVVVFRFDYLLFY